MSEEERRPKAYLPSDLNLQNFYTSSEEAGKLIRERWANAELRARVEKEYGDKVPSRLLEAPTGVLWRQIGTPDREFERYLELAKEAQIDPVCLETVEDKFVGGNFTKLGLANLPFRTGVTKDGRTIVEKIKIVDFNTAGGKRLCDIPTLWGESLVDFHHRFLKAKFPNMDGRIVDIYEWTKHHGPSPEEYYPAVLAFALSHYILFDDYDLLEAEDDFTNEAVLPAFKRIEEEFGLRPIVVKISNPGEHAFDQYWWSYTEETKAIMERLKEE